MMLGRPRIIRWARRDPHWHGWGLGIKIVHEAKSSMFPRSFPSALKIEVLILIFRLGVRISWVSAKEKVK